MEPTTWAVLVAVVSTASVWWCLARGHHPGEQRTSLFESPDGERENPFATADDQAASTGPQCRRCRSSVEAEPFRYCPGCVSAD